MSTAIKIAQAIDITLPSGGFVRTGTGAPLFHVQSPDGANQGDFIAKFVNLDVTDNQGQGVLIQAGNGVNDAVLSVVNSVGTTLMRVNGLGTVLIGSAVSYLPYVPVGPPIVLPRFEIHGTAGNVLPMAGMFAWGQGGSTRPIWVMRNSYGTTVGAYTIVPGGRNLGELRWGASDGVGFSEVASISCRMTAGVLNAANNFPSNLEFYVMPTGVAAGSYELAMVLQDDKTLRLIGSARVMSANPAIPTSGTSLEIYYASGVFANSPSAYLISVDRSTATPKPLTFNASAHLFEAGTVTIASTLTVKGSTITHDHTATPVFVMAIASAIKYRMGVAATAGELVSGSNQFDVVYRVSAKAFRWTVDDGSSSAMILTSTGAVGIGGVPVGSTMFQVIMNAPGTSQGVVFSEGAKVLSFQPNNTAYGGGSPLIDFIGAAAGRTIFVQQPGEFTIITEVIGVIDFHIRTGVSTSRFMIKGSSGFVGIGTASPTERLHVLSGSSISAIFQDTGVNCGIKILANGGGSWQIFTDNANPGVKSFVIYDLFVADYRFSINTAGVTQVGPGSSASVAGIATGSDRLIIHGDAIRIDASRTPTGTSAGFAGEIAWDASFIYVCTATNVWKRAALAAF